MWLDIARPDYPPLSGPVTCDLLVSAAATPACGRALHAAHRNPGPAHRADRGRPYRLGGLRAQRRLRRRQPDPRARERKVALAQRDRHPRSVGHGEPRRHAGRDRANSASTSNGSAPGCCRWPPNRIRWLAQAGRRRGRGTASSTAHRSVTRSIRRRIWRVYSAPTRARSSTPPSWLSSWRGPAVTAGSRSTSTPRPPGSTPVAPRCACTPTAGRSPRSQAVLATNVYPSLLRRNRLYTVPVYDYVLATEPLTDAQLDRIGWQRQAGNRRLRQPVSLLPPDDGQPDRLGRLRRHLPLRTHASTPHTRTAGTSTAGWPRTSSSPSRNSTTSGSPIAGPGPSTPTPGSARTGVSPAKAGSPTSTGSPGSASAPTRFAADVCLDLLEGSRRRAPGWRWCAKAAAVSSGTLASTGIQATRWSLDRADHAAGRRNILLRALDAVGLGFDS